jgi:hypothetical protein
MRSFASLDRPIGRVVGVFAVMLTLCLGAQAELGGTESSVRADQQRLSGTRSVRQMPAYAVHEIRTRNNSVVREFVSADGKVFAVAFKGEALGESNALLGSYADQIAQALQSARGGKHRGGPVMIQTPGLVYQATGHMRSYVIHAYVPASLPQGVQAEELR